jgi:hypothetical protein
MAISCPQWQRASEAVVHGDDILVLIVILILNKCSILFLKLRIVINTENFQYLSRRVFGFLVDHFMPWELAENRRGIMGR